MGTYELVLASNILNTLRMKHVWKTIYRRENCSLTNDTVLNKTFVIMLGLYVSNHFKSIFSDNGIEINGKEFLT